ncbi:MAG TPA: FecR domain-containing protein [Terricaulis sp.]|nr:FecR domain-containing protein [Terricaulis sp.]
MNWRPSDRIANEAARWVVLIDSEEFDAAAAARFKRWIARSDAHREAFVLTNSAWTDLDALPKLKAYPEIVALLEAGLDTPLEPKPQPVMGRRALLVGGGLVALGACIVGYNILAPGAAEAFETGIGEQRTVSLADGTEVVLNASSRLEVRMGARRRQARLVAGEAYFVIAPDAALPFVITTGHGAVEAASGEVLVKLLPEGARIGLISAEGRMARRGVIGDRDFVGVSAQSEIVLDDDGMAIATPPPDQLSRRMLWREGKLVFENTPLSEAAADIARQTGVRFVFADPALAALRVGGLIQLDDLEGFLMLLRENLGLSVERRGQDIVLSAGSAR